MCLFDTSNYFAAAGAWARSCFMHLMPWMAPGNARHYLHALLKAKDLWLLQDPGLCLQWQYRCVFLHQKQPRALVAMGTAGSSMLLWALTRGGKFWSHAQLTLANCTCTELPSREKGFNHLSTTDFLKQFLCVEGEVITHFIKILGPGFIYSFNKEVA